MTSKWICNLEETHPCLKKIQLSISNTITHGQQHLVSLKFSLSKLIECGHIREMFLKYPIGILLGALAILTKAFSLLSCLKNKSRVSSSVCLSTHPCVCVCPISILDFHESGYQNYATAVN